MSRPKGGVTRRDLGLTLAAAIPLAAQQTAPPADLIADAREQWKKNAEQLRKVKVPIATEPSFIFRP
jgi:hypothetical protein